MNNKKIKKRYKQILPMNEEDTVKNQFGWLPISVFKPIKKPEWETLIEDYGDIAGSKRGSNAKYLPNLRFSKFSPHLAEIIIRYWSLKGHTIIDPFSGRATRAVVSVALGRNYIGYEVVEETAVYTQKQANKVAVDSARAIIYNEDGCKMQQTKSGIADLVFTCPPYHRLEKYASVDNQLSDITKYDDFIDAICIAADNIYRVMKIGSFLVWICADWRDRKAFRLFHKDSIDIFENTNLQIHDIMIIENISPFAKLQAGKVAAKRYTSKIHEYALVFRKI